MTALEPRAGSIFSPQLTQKRRGECTKPYANDTRPLLCNSQGGITQPWDQNSNPTAFNPCMCWLSQSQAEFPSPNSSSANRCPPVCQSNSFVKCHCDRLFHSFITPSQSFSPFQCYSSCLTHTLSPLASPAAIYVVVSAERKLDLSQEGNPSLWPPPWF